MHEKFNVQSFRQTQLSEKDKRALQLGRATHVGFPTTDKRQSGCAQITGIRCMI